MARAGTYIRTKKHRIMMSGVQKIVSMNIVVIEKNRANGFRTHLLHPDLKPPVNRGVNHYSFGLKKHEHPLFKGYKYCSDCGKELARRTATKCRRCAKLKKDTPLFKQVRNIAEYVKWRCDVWIRDNFTCQECGVKDVIIEAHHIKSFVKILRENKIKTIDEAKQCKELWNINNGKTLCEDCHKSKRIKTSDHTETIENTLL